MQKQNPFTQAGITLAPLIHKNMGSPHTPDENLPEIIGEQLREILCTFGQLATPTGARIVTADNGIDPLLWEYATTNLPVAREDLIELQDALCDSFRALAATTDLDLPGAALTLRPNNEVSIRPILTWY